MCVCVTKQDWWSSLFFFTLRTSESVILQHVSREALAPERARRVDTSVVAEVALVHQALVHVLRPHGTLRRVLPVLLLADGEGLFGVRAVGHYDTRRECLCAHRQYEKGIKRSTWFYYLLQK